MPEKELVRIANGALAGNTRSDNWSILGQDG
jgi:hypothetical protein